MREVKTITEDSSLYFFAKRNKDDSEKEIGYERGKGFSKALVNMKNAGSKRWGQDFWFMLFLSLSFNCSEETP